MSSTKYTYAVARIRALETALFTSSVIEQLLACSTEKQCLQLLQEKGWGDTDTPVNAEAILDREQEKTWETIRDMKVDMSVFDVFSYPNLFHNLKAAIKDACTSKDGRTMKIYYEDTVIPPEEMLDIIRSKERAKDRIIKEYAESMVAIADIKIAVRSQKTAKTIEFMKRAMVPCKSLSIDRLAKAAVQGMGAIVEYLESTVYANGAAAIAESPSAFERWCDNRIIHTMQPQKYETFSVGPLVAYLLARENEIKTVRIILSGKQNGFSEEAIRERVREMYV